MAKPDWEAIETSYRAGIMSLREIGTLYGVTEGAIRKKAKKLEWVRKNGTQVRKNGTQKNTVRTTRKPASSGAVQKHSQPETEPPADTKPETVRKKVVTNHPPFQPGNQYALKHGGYARRLLLKDEVVEDARALTLEDELFRLRANNLMAAENIGRWLTLLEDAEEEQQRKILMDNISAAENAMMRNTARIESIERTLTTLDIIAVTPAKIIADTEYRTAAREKVKAETDILTSQKQGVTTPMAEIVSALHGMSHSGRLDDIPEE
ncbi:hypothetical protein D9U59_08620 [Salmonella enterica]|nr:hypothetical protein [Salmonella enterica subsp. enterica serovar Kentucky]EBZ8383350.1 hypothetical protein [Salmonella enterica subsp. enterica serovar Kentucky]EBZ9245455.1 hypothetical protein [Salmonella enterica subsp. enterica serovar Kentucky]ECA0412157.1 hypothetical protein [Salmonella enterica subsp. enterica serovar Kentucky]ECB4480992.1 hypothetical protein [Salmonella enterica subsp. enterica serovar Kentucky]